MRTGGIVLVVCALVPNVNGAAQGKDGPAQCLDSEQARVVQEGEIDDALVARDLEYAIVMASKNPAKLEKLRAKVLDLYTGHDTARGKSGLKPSLSPETGRSLIGLAEKYLSEVRAEQRQIKGDAQTQDRSALAIVKQEIEAKFDALAGTSYYPQEQAKFKARKADALIQAEKAGKDLPVWFEKFKADKVNADVFGGKQVDFPSWAIMKGTTFDANATRARLKQEFDRRTITQAEFQRRMDEVKRFEIAAQPQ